MRTGALLAVSVALMAEPATAAGTSAAGFLELPTGAVPAAMADAYTALADDAHALNANPAAMAFAPATQVTATHLSYIEAIQYETLGVVRPNPGGVSVGVGLQYLRYGETSATDGDGRDAGAFDGADVAYSLALGTMVSRRLSLGFTGKLIRSRIASYAAGTMAADFAGFWKHDRWSLGAVIANLGRGLRFVDHESDLPRAARVGAGFRPTATWTISMEEVWPAKDDPSLRAGIQWQPAGTLCLRAGYRSDRRDLSSSGLTAGVGFRLFGHQLAYAWAPMGDFQPAHTFSMVFAITPGHDQRLSAMAGGEE